MKKFSYMKEGLKSEPHTPVYKMHKYFARRPQNVFRALAENYTSKGDVILDVFCGGGVTLFEALSVGRKVIANDINPLASFISRMEVTKVDKKSYLDAIEKIKKDVEEFSDKIYSTHNRDTGELLPVRWYEHAYKVKCPCCGSDLVLSNESKAEKAGVYKCPHCKEEVKGVDCENIGTELISVTYKVTTRATQRTVTPDEYDIELSKEYENEYEKYVKELELWIPEIEIPATWDRQQEDCLHRKGVLQFSDFFMKRSLIVMGYFLKKIHECKADVSEDVYDLLILTFSATIRYTNNLTISTNAWQDGRPVAWAKHAYWLSYQFVEVNPVEYIEKRITAMKAALDYQQQKLPDVTQVYKFSDLMQKENSYIVLNQDSGALPLEDESVDMVLTDPPYGSNVQYGELSAFWLAWIYPELGISKERVLDLTKEILVNRKKNSYSKDHEFYYAGLKKVFDECYRVLKDGCPMVFTFNNKDPKVWLAVMKAALDSGFVLEPDGIIYQEPIDNYINTAHTKYAGAVLGDFIYTFIKKNESGRVNPLDVDVYDLINKQIDEEIINSVQDGKASTNNIFINVFRKIIPTLSCLALEQKNYKFASDLFKANGIESRIKSLCCWDDNEKKWRRNNE